MRYCHNCHRLSAQQPPFCNFCGCTFNVRLCPRLHINPRAARVCSECGSSELSSPQPKIPLLLRPVIFVLQLGPGFFLLVAALVFFALYIRQLLADPNGLLPLLTIVIGLGLALTAWIKIRSWRGKGRK